MSKVDQVIADATAELGKPYNYGDEGPNAFDCSGLIQFVFGEVGIPLPRTAAQQQAATSRVSNPLPGDLVFYGDPAYHVGLYLGAGKMISAPHSGSVVHVTDVGQPTGYGRVAGLGTLLAPALGLVAAGAQTVANPLSSILGGARTVVVEFLFAGLGLGLVGYGVYRTLSPARRAALTDITGGT